MHATSGNINNSTRSDCQVRFTIDNVKGQKIILKSKVEKLYGIAIKKLCDELTSFYEIEEYQIEIEDAGALPFVIAARLETAIKQLKPSNKNFLLPDPIKSNGHISPTSLRRSRLYLPGNDPKLMINAGIYGADAIILDLEDSVSPEKKTEARILVRNALGQIDFYGAEKMVRINQMPLGADDLKAIVPCNVDTILIPKVEKPDDVFAVEKEIEKWSPDSRKFFLMPIIESALGIENAFEIACSSKNIVALAIGLEDYTADIGAQRSAEGKESFYARSRIVNATAAAGIQAIDSVYSEFQDLEELKKVAEESKSLGFVGMGCIHPAQIKVVNDVFSPNESEIEKAKSIVLAFYDAQKNGKSVVAVGSKMVDPPVVKRALNVIEYAIICNKLTKDWRE